jgi:GntR family transcriptional regulator
MNIVLSEKSDKPLYEQIVDEIEAQILKGEIHGNEQLPPIRELALSLKVSVITTKMAYERMTADGYLYSFTGRGTFVNSFTQEELEKKKQKKIQETLDQEIRYLDKFGIGREEMIEYLKK